MRTITVNIPATTANLGSGFDTFGAALELRNTITALIDTADNGVAGSKHFMTAPTITIEGEGAGELPQDASNLIWRAMLEVFKKLKIRRHNIKELKFTNRIPLSSGLGSSAAAIAGGLVLANEISGRKFRQDELINMAGAIEGHPDNVVPAFMGGFCICYDGRFYKSRRISYLKFPDTIVKKLKAIVCVPSGIRYSTSFARRILPEKISLEDAVFNISHAALLSSALALNRFEYLKEAMNDRIHQQRRISRIKGAREAFEQALSSGEKDLLGVALSGSGPSLVAIIKSKGAGASRHHHYCVQPPVASALQEGFASRGIKSRLFVLDFAREGITVVKS